MKLATCCINKRHIYYQPHNLIPTTVYTFSRPIVCHLVSSVVLMLYSISHTIDTHTHTHIGHHVLMCHQVLNRMPRHIWAIHALHSRSAQQGHALRPPHTFDGRLAVWTELTEMNQKAQTLLGWREARPDWQARSQPLLGKVFIGQGREALTGKRRIGGCFELCYGGNVRGRRP